VEGGWRREMEEGGGRTISAVPLVYSKRDLPESLPAPL
jgi:hypothetical protein